MNYKEKEKYQKSEDDSFVTEWVDKEEDLKAQAKAESKSKHSKPKIAIGGLSTD